ncbi:MAG: NosR/NirI family protein [Gammaproteobacteria bacterium]|nr:NosR/NirI family protein [Gammaproteobacteria bacterium]
MCLSLIAVHAGAASVAATYPAAKQFFPTADRFTDFEGEPLAATAMKGDQVLGYLFRTDDVARIPAYSGKPVNHLVGIDTAGTIVGVKVLEHHEPILLVGIPESRLDEFVAQYKGKNVSERIKVGAGKRPGYVNVDAITGATVTVMVMNEGILRSGRKVAESRGIIKPDASVPTQPARVRTELFEKEDWKFLTGNGAIRRLLLTRGEVDATFKGTEAEGLEDAPADKANDTFIDLYYAYLDAPTIGRNLLGESQFNWLMAELKPGEQAIAVMANGIYSFKGSGYVRGGIFDRILLTQGGREISFRDLDYHRLNDVYAEGMPAFSEMGMFIIRADQEFDPGQPWRLELLVKRQTGPLDSVFSSFAGEYDIPEMYIERPEPVAAVADVDEPIWVQVWSERKFQIFVLVSSLILLTLIMALQDWLVRFPRLIFYLRTGFLVYTLFFIGWYLLGQLSVVNVLTFTGALMHDFKWDTFLIDPTMFILWTFVAGSLLLWGRGVYCGWLCPFGALQKLVNEIARYFRVRQFVLPQIIHDRLWGIKYLILMVLFGISLQSLGTAERYAEIEPFKTAITLRFNREWIFILYAAGLVVVSAFNCKFYCKYLCPLGAALAVPTKFALVSWLRRRRECGNPCQICANECEIQAIHTTGEINLHECHYCLDCQVTYWNDHKCPPLVERRKRHERAGRARAKAREMEADLGATSGLKEIPVTVEKGAASAIDQHSKP